MSPDADVIERLVWPLIECIAPLVGAELVLTGGNADVIERLVWPLIECITPLVGAELVLTGARAARFGHVRRW